jgi:signal transduction histidine kinase
VGVRKKEGTGLGLYISKKIGEILDCRLTAESTPGEGSTFTFFVSGCGEELSGGEGAV